MLVLTRKADQTIRIGGEIEVTVVSIDRDQVKIGISAPQDVRILRQEIVDEIQAANRDAAREACASATHVGPPPPRAPEMATMTRTAEPGSAHSS